MLLSKMRERNIIRNTILQDMVEAEERLEQLCQSTIQDAEASDWPV